MLKGQPGVVVGRNLIGLILFSLDAEKSKSEFGVQLTTEAHPPDDRILDGIPAVSLAIPIRREKKGLASLAPPKSANRSILSMKN